jgi:dolichyl-phosphate-mannose-protein mannosyltransferase
LSSRTAESALSSQLVPVSQPQQARIWLVIGLTLVLGRALPNITYPIGRDQATFGVIGQGLLHGQQIYRDLWDMKPPGIFYTYAAIVKVFGTVMWSVGLVDILWLLAISYCIFRYAERHLGAPAAFIAVAINAAWHCRADYLNAAQPETFLMIFVFAAYLAADGMGRWPLARRLAAGMLLGVAFWFKYNALPFFLLVLFVPYLDKQRLNVWPPRLGLGIPWRQWGGNAAAQLAGFSAVVGGVMLCFWHAGLWEAFTQSHLKVASRYSAVPFEQLHGGYWRIFVGSTITGLGPWTLGATASAIAVARKKRAFCGLAPILLAALAGYVSEVMQTHLPLYGFETCYPFFAMIWAYYLTMAFEDLKRFRQGLLEQRRRFYAASVLAALVVTLAIPVTFEAISVAHRYREIGDWSRNPDRYYAGYSRQFYLENLDGQLQVIRFIKENSRPGACVYEWGSHALLYFQTGSCVPTRFIPNIPLMSPWAPPSWRQELIRDLERTQPAYIVVARHDELGWMTVTSLDSEKFLTHFPQLAEYIARSYEPAKSLPDFVIYRRTSKPSI